MSKSYTPGLKVLDKTTIEKERILPLKGVVHVELDEKVKAEDIVASTEIPGNIQMINIANELNIDSDQIKGAMLCDIDDAVVKGQVIARNNGLFGFFKSEVVSPLDGVIANISEVTGQVIISEKPIPVQVDAYLSGKVCKVIDKEGVSIKSSGTLIQGIIGVGGEKKGLIHIFDKENGSIDECRNKIIVIESNLTYDFYEKISDLDVLGIICGSIDYQTLTKILKKPLGVAITGTEDVVPVIVTEGFGKVDMANRTYSLLKKNNLKYASINGATQIRAGVMRPEVFIALDDDSEFNSSFDESSLVISIGSKVRIIREPYFGQIGEVLELPSSLVKIDTETVSRVAKVQLDDRSVQTIPRANLEVILLDNMC